jgi:hypothetical protein
VARNPVTNRHAHLIRLSSNSVNQRDAGPQGCFFLLQTSAPKALCLGALPEGQKGNGGSAFAISLLVLGRLAIGAK